MPGAARLLAAFLLLSPAGLAAGGAPAEPEGAERPDPARWRLLGSFKGSTSSRLMQELNDLVFEMESDGGLYQDLGAVTLGIGADASLNGAEVDGDWDNSFYRRVEPLHAALEPGEPVTGDDVSRYVDIQSIVSRGRLRYGFAESLVGDDLGVGVVVEGGTGLTLARARRPLVYAERPLAEVLAERGEDDFQELLTAEKPPLAERSLVRLSAEGLAALARKLAHSLRRTVDTERGVIFYQNAADPMTLLIDLGVPVPAELFTAEDRRLAVGDRVRHVTFVGVSPLAAGIRKYGMEARYEGFVRLLRETTIVKEAEGHALVKVRDLRVRGHELVPFKFRPRVKILRIIRLGYTFFEQRFDRSRGVTSEAVYRFDLSTEQGMESFEALLAAGERVRWRPRRDPEAVAGTELLGAENRRGARRLNLLRARFFSSWRFQDRETVVSELVESGGVAHRELTVARSRQLKKKPGLNRRWKREYLISSRDNLGLEGAGDGAAARSAAVNLLNGQREDFAVGPWVRRAADLLAATFGPHPVLDELASIPAEERVRFFTNVRLSFGVDHLLYFRELGDDRLWAELADILLGPEHRQAWATAEARARFSQRRVRRHYRQLLADAASLPNPTLEEPFGPRDRLRLAARAVKKFHRIQDLIRIGDCPGCLSDAFVKWKQINLLQVLLYRLAAESGAAEPGYHYEVFTDRMLKPVTVTNGVTYDFDPAAAAAAGAPAVETAEAFHKVDRAQDWIGTRSVFEPADARLRGGSLYLNVDPEAAGGEGEPCWKLRLYSDLRFAPELKLRIDLRRSGGITADVPLGQSLFGLGEPTAVVATPFMTARYFYDVPLPAIGDLEADRGYTLLLRVLNPEGLPVSEEQQLRFEWAEEGAPPDCWQEPAAGASPPES